MDSKMAKLQDEIRKTWFDVEPTWDWKIQPGCHYAFECKLLLGRGETAHVFMPYGKHEAAIVTQGSVEEAFRQALSDHVYLTTLVGDTLTPHGTRLRDEMKQIDVDDLLEYLSWYYAFGQHVETDKEVRHYHDRCTGHEAFTLAGIRLCTACCDTHRRAQEVLRCVDKRINEQCFTRVFGLHGFVAFSPKPRVYAFLPYGDYAWTVAGNDVPSCAYAACDAMRRPWVLKRLVGHLTYELLALEKHMNARERKMLEQHQVPGRGLIKELPEWVLTRYSSQVINYVDAVLSMKR